MNKQKETPFLNLGFNIILPVLILNKGQNFIHSESAPVYILLIALSLPFFYGLMDFVRSRKINAVSVIGLVSVAMTGGLALWEVEGIYFALKEAGVPLILALVTWGSIFFKKPIASLLVFKTSLFDTELIQSRLKGNQKEGEFKKLMNSSTWILGAGFILSAVLNFIIAILVFKDIDPALKEELRRQLVNEQIADMTWMGYIFIALPLTFITGALLWWILKQLKSWTGLSLEELISPERKITT